jgi:hypothetical protein
MATVTAGLAGIADIAISRVAGARHIATIKNTSSPTMTTLLTLTFLADRTSRVQYGHAVALCRSASTKRTRTLIAVEHRVSSDVVDGCCYGDRVMQRMECQLKK